MPTANAVDGVIGIYIVTETLAIALAVPAILMDVVSEAVALAVALTDALIIIGELISSAVALATHEAAAAHVIEVVMLADVLLSAVVELESLMLVVSAPEADAVAETEELKIICSS
jgi:hypothetical protein